MYCKGCGKYFKKKLSLRSHKGKVHGRPEFMRHSYDEYWWFLLKHDILASRLLRRMNKVTDMNLNRYGNIIKRSYKK